MNQSDLAGRMEYDPPSEAPRKVSGASKGEDVLTILENAKACSLLSGEYAQKGDIKLAVDYLARSIALTDKAEELMK